MRHLLPDGRGTDVLGTCLSWTDADVVIDRDQPGSGETGPVRIAVSTIITGKPIPPRASVRSRLSPREVEEHVLSLWPEVETASIGDWQLRAAPAYEGRRRRRGNSALAMGDPGVPVAEAAERIVGFYRERGQEPLAQAVAGSPEESALLAYGWRALESGRAHCQLASVPRALRAATSASNRRSVAPDGANSRRDVPLTAGYKEEGSRVEVTLTDGHGRTAARGRAALDGDWVGLHDLYVDPDRRREGLATAVVANLLDWGASLGATTAWLHVETDNAAAIALYEALGFVTHHMYGYLTTGAPAE